MARPPSPESEQLRAFRDGYEKGQRAFNEGDIEGAFAALPDQIEYRLAGMLPDVRPLHSRAEVISFMREMKEVFPDYRSESLDFVETEEGKIVVSNQLFGTGQGSGVRVGVEVFQVWELENGVPVRMREYTDRAEAFRAAGLTPPETRKEA